MNPDKAANIGRILLKHWGYDSFRPMQREIIESVLDGRDTLGLLPTGGGKSITFQVPALALPGLTIVVTPLISLMKDQVDNLRSRGVKAVYLHSALSRREFNLAVDRCRLGKVKLLYVSPEKLRSPSFVDHMRTFTVSLIVVDEAHCISQWGYDFRPSYLHIASLRKQFPKAPVLALTASATPEVVTDIMHQLQFTQPNLFARSFARSNLSYLVRHTDSKDSMLLKILRNTRGCAIVYVRSRRRTREIAASLQQCGISADYYHAGLATEDKNEKQNRWKSDTVRVMVATNAFGMGIDKPDVRVVVHYDIPSSLEEYYQEAGRGGRDGLDSYAVLLTSPTDKAQLTRRLNEAFPDIDYIRRVYELAGNFLNVAVGEGFGKVYDFNFGLFCERFSLKPTMTRNALMLLTRAGYIEYIDEVATMAKLMVLLRKDELYALKPSPDADRVLQHALRTYTGLFADYVAVDDRLMSLRLNMPQERVYQALLELNHLHAVHFIPRKQTPFLIYTTSREMPQHVRMPLEMYDVQRRRMEQRIEAMRQFAFTDDVCRQNLMLRYFGENPTSECTKCDHCRSMRASVPSADRLQQLRQSILYLASQPGGHTVDYIAAQLAVTPAMVADSVRIMADEGLLMLDGLNVTANA